MEWNGKVRELEKTIYLAGGCFWGMQKYLASIRSVKQTEAGFANGATEHPTYEEVCRNNTGHAETVKVTYDPDTVSLGFLIGLYFDAIDPTAVNRQGGDSGTQYRTGIYYESPEDGETARAAVRSLRERIGKPVAVEVRPLENYSPAEESHQNYLDKNPGGYCHISPQKIARAARAAEKGTARNESAGPRRKE